jgi:hypothetical protein
MREIRFRGGLRNNSSRASSVSLDDKIITSGSAGRTEQCGGEARTGSIGCEACAGQIKINKINQIFLPIVYHIAQQPTQLKSHHRSVFFLSSFVMGHTSDGLCNI